MAYLAYNPFPQYTDDNGNPLSGGRIAWYISSSSTLKTVYQSDPTLSNPTPADNPAILQSDGRTQTPVYYGQGTYKVVLESSDGAGGFDPYKTIDPVFGNMSLVAGASPDVSVENISKLRLLTAGDFSLINVGGYRSGGDGGGGQFWYSPTSTLIDDGGVVIAPSGSPAQGRYLRLLERPVVNPQMFGATLSYTGNEISFFNEMITASNAYRFTIEVTPKEYITEGNLTFPATAAITWFQGAKVTSVTDDGTYTLSMLSTDVNILSKDAITSGMDLTLDTNLTAIPEWFAGCNEDKFQLAWRHAGVLIDRDVRLTPGFDGAASYGSSSAAPEVKVINDAVITSLLNVSNPKYAYIGGLSIDHNDTATFAIDSGGLTPSLIFVDDARNVKASWFQIPTYTYLTFFWQPLFTQSSRISFEWDYDFAFSENITEVANTGMEHVMGTQGYWDLSGFNVKITNISIPSNVKHFANVGQLYWNSGPSVVKPEWFGAYANVLTDQKIPLTEAALLANGTGLPLVGGPFYIDGSDTYWTIPHSLDVVDFSIGNVITTGRQDIVKITDGTFTANNMNLDRNSRISAEGTDTNVILQNCGFKGGAIFTNSSIDRPSVINGCVIGDLVGRSTRELYFQDTARNFVVSNSTFYTRITFKDVKPSNTYINNNTFIASVTVNDNHWLGNGTMNASDMIIRNGVEATTGHKITVKGNTAVGNYILNETNVKFQVQIDAINDITLDGGNYELDKEVNITTGTCLYTWGKNPVHASMQLGRAFTREAGITGAGYLQDPQVYIEDVTSSYDPLALVIGRYTVNLWGDWKDARITPGDGYNIYQNITLEIDWSFADGPQTFPWV